MSDPWNDPWRETLGGCLFWAVVIIGALAILGVIAGK